MPETYEDATTEEAAKDSEDQYPDDEFDPDVTVKTLEEAFDDVESTVEDVPGWLRPGTDGVTQPGIGIGGRRGSIGLNINLDDIGTADVAGLLEIIARIEAAQLATLLDIADQTSPYNDITVSGINTIDTANQTEVVVPRSDDEDIPTRALMMRASSDNSDKIYIGDDDTSPGSGIVLESGEFYVLEIDLRGEELYMASPTVNQEIQLLGVR